MEKKHKSIVTNNFEEQGHQIYNYIQEDSPQSADKMSDELKLLIQKIQQNPEAYPVERFLLTKRRLYRFALLMKKWKVIYKVTSKLVVFLGIIHTAQHPKEIKKLRTTKYE